MNKIVSRLVRLFFVSTFVFGTFSILACAQEMKKDGEMKKDDAMMKKEDMRPIVAVIRADWCPYCKKLEPIMMGLMKDYGEKLNFVVFDITNDETIAKSMELAKEKGLEEFFKENKDKSAFVVIFKEGKEKFKAKYKTERDVYVKEFDKVLMSK